MKKRLNKIVSLICTLALIVSMCSFVTAFASGEVRIITAQFMPYEGQIKVLASLADGYTNAKVYVNGTEIATTSATQADGDVVFTSTSFTPAAYGVATVKLEANVGAATYSDTQNVKIYKVTSKTNALSENFDQLECIAMSDATDTSVTTLIANSSAVQLATVGTGMNQSVVRINGGYGNKTNSDNSIILNIPSTLVRNLPEIRLDPANIASGIAEFSFEMFGSDVGSRLSLRVEATTGVYNYHSAMHPRTSANSTTNSSMHNTAYYAKHHDYNTYAFSSKKFQPETWHNVRFLMNFDELTYEYYVDDEKLDYGTIVGSADATKGYKRVLMQIGCSGSDVEIAFDNINIRHLSAISAHNSKESDITSLLTFDNTVGSDAIIANNQKATVVKKCETIASKEALSFYYVKPSSSTTTVKNQNAFFAIDDFGKQDCGRIVLEHDLYVTDKSATLNYELTHTKSSAFYPLQDSSLISGGKIGSKSVDYYSGWNTIKIVVDFHLQRTEVYFNNNLVESKDGLHATTTIPNYLKVRINYKPTAEPTVDVENFAFAIDNWRIYKELPIPEIKSVTTYDISGNSAALVRTDVIPAAATDKLKIALSNTEYLNQASLEANVKVLADGAQVQDAVSLSDGTLTIDVSDVPAHADLELVIGKDTLLYDGTTTIGADTVFNLKSANENGLYIKRAVDTNGEALSADCDLDVVSGSKNVVAIFASYDGDELVGITSKAATLTGAKSLSMTLPKASATKVKVFVWDDIASNATPYETQISYSIPSQN